MAGLTSHLIFNSDVPDAAHMLGAYLPHADSTVLGTRHSKCDITYNQKARMGRHREMSGFEMHT